MKKQDLFLQKSIWLNQQFESVSIGSNRLILTELALLIVCGGSSDKKLSGQSLNANKVTESTNVTGFCFQLVVKIQAS